MSLAVPLTFRDAFRAAPARTALLIAPGCGWLLSTVSEAQAASPLPDAEPHSVATLVVLLAGLGVLLVAAGVLTFAVRQLRREAAERRKTYSYRRRGPDGTPPPAASG